MLSCVQSLHVIVSILDTYSADFQKWPGCDSLRLSLGSFSSMSASWVKVGLSLRSYDQQAERISWDDRQLWVSDDRPNRLENILISLHHLGTVDYLSLVHKRQKHVLFWMTDTLMLVFQLTVTSLPRLISAKTFFMPSPLPTCQMVASTGWLMIGQSLAWSSYQMVLKEKGNKSMKCLSNGKLSW